MLAVTFQVNKPLKKDLLSVDLAGLKLHSPTVLASGILGYSADSLEAVAENGAGAGRFSCACRFSRAHRKTRLVEIAHGDFGR